MEKIEWEKIILAMVVTFIGAIANYLYKLDRGLKFTFLSLFSNLFISSFGGLLMFLIGTYFDINPLLIGSLCGISGWSGAKVIEAMESRWIDKIKNGDIK